MKDVGRLSRPPFGRRGERHRGRLPGRADEAGGTVNHSYAPEAIAASTLVCLPVVVVFFVTQRYFLKGHDR